ncbi:hypothetical protein [Bradyrhizobium canariense]|uniref:hypothetical protein n=1 Tax=Bradyrhizobium canariense TaxID=255045 RepID=UPI001B8A5A8D|nr:hypothetical protein [Bradyrhizobium canariense]MBR0949469.1 hypothetical protein [Bradyrhizobium canariense]
MDGGTIYRENYEECRAEAAKANSPSSKAQWLLFADEWLRLALAAEAKSQHDTGNPVAAN